MKPTISIISGTLNRPESYKRFIDSLKQYTTASWEAIISDVSDDPRYAQDEENIRVLVQRPRLGVIKGFNIGFRAARGKYCVWFNDDVSVLPGWDTAAIEFMEKHTEVGVGCIYMKDSHHGVFQERFCVQSLYGIQYANFGFFRREFGQQLGFFDENAGMRMYGCDTDFCFSAIMAGHAVAPMVESKVLHYREDDEHRKKNIESAKAERQAFDKKWQPKLQELQAKAHKFGYLRRATWID